MKRGRYQAVTTVVAQIVGYDAVYENEFVPTFRKNFFNIQLNLFHLDAEVAERRKRVAYVGMFQDCGQSESQTG
jgi:hypothetical protein